MEPINASSSSQPFNLASIPDLKLASYNYDSWLFLVAPALKVANLWGILQGTEPAVTALTAPVPTTAADRAKRDAAVLDYQKRVNQACGVLTKAIASVGEA